MSSDQPVLTKPQKKSWRQTFRDSPIGHGPLRGIVETVVLIVVAVCLALIVKTFFVQAFYIPSSSMEPGLQVNDRILVEKPSYWFGGTPQRGDIIVFSDPGNWLGAEDDAPPASGLGKLMAKIGLYPTGGHLVKRVIGVAGDTVVCCTTSGQISVNGKALNESSFVRRDGYSCDGPMRQNGGSSSGGGCSGWKAVVPAGRLFVMGDNRGNSADSSCHLCSPAREKRARTDPRLAATCLNAFVPTSDVVGKVAALVWPAGRFKLLHRPGTFNGIPAAKG